MMTFGKGAANSTSDFGIALRTHHLLAAMAVLAIISVASEPGRSFAQDCARQEISTTPASPPNARSYELYRKQLQSVTSSDVDLILLGDSLAEYWNIRMFLPYTAFNMGVAGDKTQNVLWRLDNGAWSNLRPRVVFIILGTNNLADDEPCAIAAGIKTVIERVTTIWPVARVVFLEITPRGTMFTQYADSRTEINVALHDTPGIVTINVDDEITCRAEPPFQVRSATVQHRRHGGVNGRGKGQGQGL
jgi:hypothetical protein